MRAAIVAKRCREVQPLLLELEGLMQKNGVTKSKSPQVVFTVGGDGTVLESERLYPSVPKFCINGGRTSFLGEVETEELEEKFGLLLRKKYSVDERTKLSCPALPDALNEIAVISSKLMRMMEVEVEVNGHFLTRLRGDGLIVATPTGSTAHSLAAGGPIIMPGSRVMSLTPLAPFRLASRPLVVSDSARIEVMPTTDVLVASDGQSSVTVKSGEPILVKRSRSTAKFLRFGGNYFRRLKKLIIP